MNRTRICSLLALVGLVLAPSAQAQTTITFESLPNPTGTGMNAFNQGFTLSIDGFTFSGGNGSVTPDANASVANYTGSVAIFNGSTTGSTTITRDNGNPFSINSIDLANLYQQGALAGGTAATFVGNLQGGGTVTQTFTHAADSSLTTFTFDPSFANLTSVVFAQNNINVPDMNPYQFDNVVFDTPGTAATPEPGSIALAAGVSVVGAGFCRRRRRRRRPTRTGARAL